MRLSAAAAQQGSKALNQQQRGVLEQMPQFLQIFRAERAIDHAMVAAHADRHALADQRPDRNRRPPASC